MGGGNILVESSSFRRVRVDKKYGKTDSPTDLAALQVSFGCDAHCQALAEGKKGRR